MTFALGYLARRLVPLLALAEIGMLFWQPKIPAQQYVAGRPALRTKADASGQFHVTPVINGIPIGTLVDTGASAVSLGYEDAIRLKFDPHRLTCNISVKTANGETCAARVRLSEVRLGTLNVLNVDGLIARRGALEMSLLGMSFLKHVKLRIEAGELALYR